MSPILQLWSTSTLILATMMFTSAWLTGGGISVAHSRIALATAASACLLLVIHRWWRKAVVARLKPLVHTLSGDLVAGHNEAGARMRENDEISKLESLVHRISSGRQTYSEAYPDSGPELVATSLCGELSGNLRLAADHLESIKTLLEVSQSHQQPIPRAAFQNLELVSKNLRAIERQFGSASQQDTRSDSVLQFR
jgi:hypothetical protein